MNPHESLSEELVLSQEVIPHIPPALSDYVTSTITELETTAKKQKQKHAPGRLPGFEELFSQEEIQALSPQGLKKPSEALLDEFAKRFNEAATKSPTQSRLDTFRTIREQLSQSQPQYDGLAAELQREVTQKQSDIADTRSELKEKFFDDGHYWMWHEGRVRGGQIEAKLTDPDDKAWVAARVSELKQKQATTTRGKKLAKLEKTTAELTRFQHLQQLLPKGSFV